MKGQKRKTWIPAKNRKDDRKGKTRNDHVGVVSSFILSAND